MTAAESFWNALENGDLPATVLVVDEDGDRGIATQEIPFRDNPEAVEMVFHPDWRVRVAAGVMACKAAFETAELKYGLQPAIK